MITLFYKITLEHKSVKVFPFQQSRPAGPMARRLTTNQEIAGSIPASVNIFDFWTLFSIDFCAGKSSSPGWLHYPNQPYTRVDPTCIYFEHSPAIKVPLYIFSRAFPSIVEILWVIILMVSIGSWWAAGQGCWEWGHPWDRHATLRERNVYLVVYYYNHSNRVICRHSLFLFLSYDFNLVNLFLCTLVPRMWIWCHLPLWDPDVVYENPTSSTPEYI